MPESSNFGPISPGGGEPRQVTHNPFDIASAFSWNPNGKSIAYVADNSIFTSDAETGAAARLTPRSNDATAPRQKRACSRPMETASPTCAP